ncbi:hypothetical protein C9J12_19610 [Photobacterium frigidiphilum]|uniref:Uncharacterized protein n=1 Tax=Photobacterium frigidiphilum TaxID=264736 RepID=A0A2T3JBP5_9GAMM|nr:hypothetical protein C9J12_19610 [Photobacterium frigidiphilum]
MLRWPLATVKWRAACAERCTCGSVRRGREIVRLRSVSYSTTKILLVVISIDERNQECINRDKS